MALRQFTTGTVQQNLRLKGAWPVMFAKLMYFVGSLFVGAAGVAADSPLTVAAALCFLVGTMATFKEYEE